MTTQWHKKYIKNLFVLIVVLGLSITLKFLLTSKPHLPVYEGRDLDEWFYGNDGNARSNETFSNANSVYRHMGTNSIPFLLEKIKTRETEANKIYIFLFPKLPSIVRSRVNWPLYATYLRRTAWDHLMKLSNKDVDVYSKEILKLGAAMPTEDVTVITFEWLMQLANRVNNTGEVTEFLISKLNDSNIRIRIESALMLHKLNVSNTNTIPILISALTNKQILYQSYLVKNVSRTNVLSTNVNPAVGIQNKAYQALLKISPKLAKQYYTNLNTQ